MALKNIITSDYTVLKIALSFWYFRFGQWCQKPRVCSKSGVFSAFLGFSSGDLVFLGVNSLQQCFKIGYD